MLEARVAAIESQMAATVSTLAEILELVKGKPSADDEFSGFKIGEVSATRTISEPAKPSYGFDENTEMSL